jgi:hypothetical protein
LRSIFPITLAIGVAAVSSAFLRSEIVIQPATIEAGAAISIRSTGSGKAVLYIVGPGQALRRDVQLGEATEIAAGSLCNAGRYLVVLAGDTSTETVSLDVIPSQEPSKMSFLARPSRLPVSLHDGITGAAYVHDAFGNLIVTPIPVSFELTDPSGVLQKRVVTARDGAAWTAMDSTAHQGSDNFVARIGGVMSERVVVQVPGDPCAIKMSARPAEGGIELETDAVRDCSGNAVPDGTIVTFTETFNGTQSTVDVPLKRGIAKVEMPAHPGATVSAASGIVLGNQIRWEK